MSLWTHYYLKWISELGQGWQTLVVSRYTRWKNLYRMHRPRSFSPNKNWGSRFLPAEEYVCLGFLSLSRFVSFLLCHMSDFIISTADSGQEPIVRVVRAFKDSENSYLRLKNTCIHIYALRLANLRLILNKVGFKQLIKWVTLRNPYYLLCVSKALVALSLPLPLPPLFGVW